jgi:LmbE family N-acetylglucosaminyl deacetylase
MAKEPVKIPSNLTDPGEQTGRKVVMFIYGHFDDDSAIAGTLNMYLAAGWEVHQVWVTTAGMDSFWYGTQESRTKEMEEVAKVTGVPAENRHLIGIHDREAVKHLPEIADQVTELIARYKPSVVFTCAYEGGHWDHDSSSLAAAVASRRLDFAFERYEFPTYNRSGPKIARLRFNHFLESYGPPQYVQLDDEAWAMRKKVRSGYKSQWFLMMPEGMIYAYRHLRGRGEAIRKAPAYDYLQPPHEGTLFISAKVVGALRGAPFSDWQKGVCGIPEFTGKESCPR